MVATAYGGNVTCELWYMSICWYAVTPSANLLWYRYSLVKGVSSVKMYYVHHQHLTVSGVTNLTVLFFTTKFYDPLKSFLLLYHSPLSVKLSIYLHMVYEWGIWKCSFMHFGGFWMLMISHEWAIHWNSSLLVGGPCGPAAWIHRSTILWQLQYSCWIYSIFFNCQ